MKARASGAALCPPDTNESVTPFGVTKNAVLAGGMIFYRSVPTKKIASVPGPECAPMTGPV